MKIPLSLRTLLFLACTTLSTAAPEPPPPASKFYVDLSQLPNFHKSPHLPPLHIWAGHLLAEPDNFIPPGPNETPQPNLPVQSHLYFVLIKARRAADKERTVWWFNGGPGCSSFDGLMMEVGPWRFDKDGELWETEGGWEEYTNMIFVDQPVGTGFSYGSTDKYLHELSDVPEQMMEFMRNFYTVFPELAHQDTYLAGESFAGQYIPYIANALVDNAQSSGPQKKVPINLAGIAIGNGWIDSRNQYPAYVDFALQAGLFSPNSEEHLRSIEAFDHCKAVMDKLSPDKNPVSIHGCDGVMESVLQPFVREENGKKQCMNVYDIRLMDDYPACGMNWPPDLDQVYPWLRKPRVVSVLHASDKDTAWIECSGRVGAEMHNRQSQSSVQFLPRIASKMPVLIFAGDQDVICNYVGQEMFLKEMTWNGEKGLGQAPSLAWTVNGTQAGTWQTARNVSYVKIFQASHMVGFDLPHVSHDMILRFMGVDFSAISDGTVGHITSSLGDGEKDRSPGTDNGTSGQWGSYYKAGTAALVIVLIAVAIGTFLYCRTRRSSPLTSRISLRPSRDGYMNGTIDEESIPLNPAKIANGDEDLEDSRRRKGKGRAVHFDEEERERVFEIGDEEDGRHPER